MTANIAWQFTQFQDIKFTGILLFNYFFSFGALNVISRSCFANALHENSRHTKKKGENKQNLPKIYGLYRSPLMYESFKLLLFFDLWLFSSMSVKISGKHFKMLCLDAGIVLLFNSLTFTQIVGIGHFSSLANGDVVTLLFSLMFFLKFGILLSICYSNYCVQVLYVNGMVLMRFSFGNLSVFSFFQFTGWCVICVWCLITQYVWWFHSGKNISFLFTFMTIMNNWNFYWQAINMRLRFSLVSKVDSNFLSFCLFIKSDLITFCVYILFDWFQSVAYCWFELQL